MELIDTIELMKSNRYQDRFEAEYRQLEIRLTKLTEMLEKWDNGTLHFNPTCQRELYDAQVAGMGIYLLSLRARAKIEGVEL